MSISAIGVVEGTSGLRIVACEATCINNSRTENGMPVRFVVQLAAQQRGPMVWSCASA